MIPTTSPLRLASMFPLKNSMRCGIDIRVLDDGLAEALKKLPERKRNTLLMYYFLEMTESEIANLQKITQSGVFKNRHHALETMKKILKEKQ